MKTEAAALPFLGRQCGSLGRYFIYFCFESCLCVRECTAPPAGNRHAYRTVCRHSSCVCRIVNKLRLVYFIAASSCHACRAVCVPDLSGSIHSRLRTRDEACLTSDCTEAFAVVTFSEVLAIHGADVGCLCAFDACQAAAVRLEIKCFVVEYILKIFAYKICNFS